MKNFTNEEIGNIYEEVSDKRLKRAVDKTDDIRFDLEPCSGAGCVSRRFASGLAELLRYI